MHNAPRYLIFAAALCLLPLSQATAAPRVTLELMTAPGFPLTGAQEWIRALKDCGADDVRIRGAQSGDKPDVKATGSGATASYRVTGLLDSSSKLHLPGQRPITRFSAGQVKAYISKLRDSGVEGVATPPAAFGLTPTQLLDLHKKMSATVTFSTAGKKSIDVARQLVDALPMQVAMDESAKPALASAQKVQAEMLGMSLGTTMAAVLRPLGLVFYAKKPTGKSVMLVITDVRNAKESWPVGWPANKSPRETLPALFTFINVEIDGFSLYQAVGAISKRLESPVLFDHNSMARHGIDGDKVEVSLPRGRTYYKKIIDKLLYQAKMKSELRIDENDKPFIWASTLKK